MIKMLLEKLSGHPGRGSLEEVERIDELIGGQLKAVDLSGVLRAIKHNDLMILIGAKREIGRRQLKVPGTTEIPKIKTAFRTKVKGRSQAILAAQKRNRKINIDFDKISPPLTVRNIKPGDRFSPLGLKGTKKIGDFLTDRKIARYLRDEIPVVEDKNGIVWLTGLEISDNVKIDKTTKKVLEIEVIRRRNYE